MALEKVDILAIGVHPDDVELGAGATLAKLLEQDVAVYVAAHRRVRGVILVTPFDSLLNVARHHYPLLPVKFLLKHPFDSAALAPGIKTPALVLIGRQDNIIPNQCSARLAQLWGGTVDTMVLDGVGHNDIQLNHHYWEAINSFLSAEEAALSKPSLATVGNRE